MLASVTNEVPMQRVLLTCYYTAALSFLEVQTVLYTSIVGAAALGF